MKRTVFFPAIKYVVPEEIELWLESMALEGWHPAVPFSDTSGVIMIFEKRTPGQYRYVLDPPQGYTPNYYRHYERYGWQVVGRIGNAVFWRAPYSGDRPRSFASPQDIKRHNSGIYRNLSLGFVCNTILMAALTLTVWWLGGTGSIGQIIAVLCADVFVFLSMGLLWHVQKKMEIGDREREGGIDA